MLGNVKIVPLPNTNFPVGDQTASCPTMSPSRRGDLAGTGIDSEGSVELRRLRNQQFGLVR
jgi:hypothetical protein